MSMMRLSTLLATFNAKYCSNVKVIFSVNGDYNTGNRVNDYSDEEADAEVDFWSVEYEAVTDSDCGYEALINVKVWTK